MSRDVKAWFRDVAGDVAKPWGDVARRRQPPLATSRDIAKAPKSCRATWRGRPQAGQPSLRRAKRAPPRLGHRHIQLLDLRPRASKHKASKQAHARTQNEALIVKKKGPGSLGPGPGPRARAQGPKLRHTSPATSRDVILSQSDVAKARPAHRQRHRATWFPHAAMSRRGRWRCRGTHVATSRDIATLLRQFPGSLSPSLLPLIEGLSDPPTFP